MGTADSLALWQRWVRAPQKIWLRRAFFQLHLWCGTLIGVYILVISVTGSVLVYRNELYRAATPKPILSKSTAPRLTDDELGDAARRVYPGYRVIRITRTRNLDQAVIIWLGRGEDIKRRLFDPRTGADLGESVPTAIRVVVWISDLHDDLFAGPTGRTVNGYGAFAILGVGVTGLVLWWPGVKTWRRSLVLPRGVGWKRVNWHLHSMIGFWSFAFLVVFVLSGIYLCFPDPFMNLADWLQPPDDVHPRLRLVDQVIYWLAYLHFGRINGIGIPCHGRGLCDQATKATWALFGLAPTAMVVTGAIMWWNRVLRPWLQKERLRSPRARQTASR
jgi:uncharacterized iron-regulated membrane protein